MRVEAQAASKVAQLRTQLGHVPHFEAMWTSTWAEVAPKRAQLGAKLRMLEPRWAEVGAKWAQVGPKLGPCWPKLTPSGAHVAAMPDGTGAFGRCWAPQLKLYQSDRAVRSHPLQNIKLPRLGTFGAGGFSGSMSIYVTLLQGKVESPGK